MPSPTAVDTPASADAVAAAFTPPRWPTVVPSGMAVAMAVVGKTGRPDVGPAPSSTSPPSPRAPPTPPTADTYLPVAACSSAAARGVAGLSSRSGRRRRRSDGKAVLRRADLGACSDANGGGKEGRGQGSPAPAHLPPSSAVDAAYPTANRQRRPCRRRLLDRSGHRQTPTAMRFGWRLPPPSPSRCRKSRNPPRLLVASATPRAPRRRRRLRHRRRHHDC